MHPHHIRRPIEGGERVKRALPLDEHPRLDLATDFAVLFVLPLEKASDKPFVELVGEELPMPDLDVRAENGTTRVRVEGMGRVLDERLRRGRIWEGRFWEKLRWKKHFHTQLIVHVPSRGLRARIRPSAAYVQVSDLQDCDLDIHADAGALVIENVSGNLVLGTEAGRIDGLGLSGSITTTTSAGAVRLELLSLDPGRHRVRTNMGAAIIEVARGLPVQIETRTSMGSSRVDAVSTRGADAILDIEADLGAIRVMESRREWSRRSPRVTPYRSSERPQDAADDEGLQKILARVADGSLSPGDAKELLRSMGWAG